jgi:hypothetical protein
MSGGALRNFRTHCDSDDWADLLIGYPQFAAISTTPPNKAPPPERPVAAWNQDDWRAFETVVRKLGAAGRLFTALEVARASNCSAQQAAHALRTSDVARINRRQAHMYFWQIREDRHADDQYESE